MPLIPWCTWEETQARVLELIRTTPDDRPDWTWRREEFMRRIGFVDRSTVFPGRRFGIGADPSVLAERYRWLTWCLAYHVSADSVSRNERKAYNRFVILRAIQRAWKAGMFPWTKIEIQYDPNHPGSRYPVGFIARASWFIAYYFFARHDAVAQTPGLIPLHERIQPRGFPTIIDLRGIRSVWILMRLVREFLECHGTVEPTLVRLVMDFWCPYSGNLGFLGSDFDNYDRLDDD